MAGSLTSLPLNVLVTRPQLTRLLKAAHALLDRSQAAAAKIEAEWRDRFPAQAKRPLT